MRTEPIYVCGVDVAVGESLDYGCWCVLNRVTGRVVYTGTGYKMPWWLAWALRILGRFGLAVIHVEV